MKIEKTKLNKKNIPYIAARSGKSVVELEAMRLAMKDQGREITLQYKVVEEPKPDSEAVKFIQQHLDIPLTPIQKNYIDLQVEKKTGEDIREA